jgi:mannan endo-1,4-beta-mannosidase
LAATPGNAIVSLTWTASAGATGYYIKRSTTSGAEAQIAAQAGTSYNDTTVTNGTKYFYVVAAYNSYGTSTDSAEVSATPVVPPLAAPSALTATPGDTQVTLAWTAVTGATSYHVKRSTAAGAETQIAASATNAYTDSGLTNGTKYFYVVTALSGAGESANSPEANATPATAAVNVTITVDPTKTRAISPFIYGTNFYGGNTNAPALLTLDRAGGNRWTAYNWINNGSNAGNDYFYENDDYLCQTALGCDASKPAEAVRLLIAGDQQAGLASLVTLQLQGYVSKDTTLVQVQKPFPNLAYFRPVVDKKSTAFTLTPPPASTDNNVYMDEFAWALDQKLSGKNIFGASPAQPTFISLDNEPELWNSTHEEIQGSTRVASNVYITKTVTLTKALKDQFPGMVIFGPAHYGFLGLYNWQGELTATPNGSNWFTDKYLQAMKTASTSYGKPLVDVYDFHWYPEEYDLCTSTSSLRVTSMTGTTLTPAQVQLIVQSPRNLWDSTFNDAANGNCNPWVYQTIGNQPINLLGRLQAKIDAENPGMKTAITEYEGGGWNHIAGTIGEADYLGIFGAQGVYAASFWPPNGTYDYAMAGFRAYRGFDGANAVFGDTSLQATSSNVANVMVYASVDSTTPGHYVFVAINRSTSSQVTAINGVTLSGVATLYQMTATSASGQNPIHPVLLGAQAVSGTSFKVTLPALSVTTIDVK